MGKIENAVQWALNIANDPSHGYDQLYRWGTDYDCSSFLITAWQQAGVPVKTNGATYTGNMYKAFINSGFEDATSKVILSTGTGLKRGDVLLNTLHHTAMVVDGSIIVHASINELGKATGGQSGDQTGREICTRPYYNYPWNYVLRYKEQNSTTNSTGNCSRIVVPYEGVVTVNSYLQVRSTPSGSEKLLGGQSMRLPNGMVVAICEENNGWGRLNNVPNAWVSLQYIKK